VEVSFLIISQMQAVRLDRMANKVSIHKTIAYKFRKDDIMLKAVSRDPLVLGLYGLREDKVLSKQDSLVLYSHFLFLCLISIFWFHSVHCLSLPF